MRLTLRFAWRAGSHCADCCVLRGRKSGRAEVAVDAHLFTTGGHVYVYIRQLTPPTTPNKFNYCDHIFTTEGLLAKFAKIKTAQKFVVIRYIPYSEKFSQVKIFADWPFLDFSG